MLPPPAVLLGRRLVAPVCDLSAGARSMRSEVRRQKARLRACCVRCFALWCVPSLLQVSWRGGDTCPFVFVLFPCRQMLLLKSFPVVSLSYRCRQRLSLFLLSLASLLQVQSCGVVCVGRIEYRFGCFPWLRASARLRDWPAYLEARYSPPPVRGLGHSSSDANVRHRGYVPASSCLFRQYLVFGTV